MSGGKKKKSSSSASTAAKSKKQNLTRDKENNLGAINDNLKENTTSAEMDSAVLSSSSETPGLPLSVDVLDRLAPPILFFPPKVAEEYLSRFCPEPTCSPTLNPSGLLANEGFPDREVPVMRRLLAMMAGIMSKASSASARTYYSRVAGTEGRRNGYFQQNLNTSVFNLFSTLSAAGNVNGDSVSSKDLHLTPPAAFTAKDGESLHGYPQRLMKFWRQLSPTEQLRLVKEEHAALTNSWIESRKSWCLCAHCKHRRMTISDLTDCLYQTYCEELEAFIASGGQGSTLYSANLTNSMEPAARARRFLFKSLSVVGEQALLPRYNQFILRLEAFSSMAFSLKDQQGLNPHINQKTKAPSSSKTAAPTKSSNTTLPSLKPSSLKSAALQASKEFLQKHGHNPTATNIDEEMTISIKDIEAEFDPNNPLKGLSFKIIQDSDEDLDDFVKEHRIRRNYSDDDLISDSEHDEYEDEDEERREHQGGIQSEDDDDLIDEETDLPIDESELMLPGGSSFPLLPAGEGPVQWSESSRIECGRTVFLMFASEMFQYRLTAAYLSHQTRIRQMKLIAEVEEEEKLEKDKRIKEEKERKEKAEQEKKKKAAKKEKAAAKANGTKPSKTSTQKQPIKVISEPVVIVETTDCSSNIEPVIEAEETTIEPEETAIESEETIIESEETTIESEETTIEPEETIIELEETKIEPVCVCLEPVPEVIVDSSKNHPVASDEVPSIFDFTSVVTAVENDEDDFDPTELVEQLAKEMNRFEMNAAPAAPAPPGFAPPPGFTSSSSVASSSSPKHLNTLPNPSSNTNNLFHFPRPPFSYENNYESEMFYPPNYPPYHHSVSPQHDQFYGHGHNHYYGHYPPPPPPHHHMMNPYGPYPIYPSPHYGINPNPHFPSHPLPPPPSQSLPSSAHMPQYPHNQKIAPGNYGTQTNFNPFPGNQDSVSTSPDGESRFQSFFSKSIFGPSSFFSQ